MSGYRHEETEDAAEDPHMLETISESLLKNP